MSCTSARWSWTTRKWASAPKRRRRCGRGNWQRRAERPSRKTRRRCTVHSAKVKDVSVCILFYFFMYMSKCFGTFVNSKASMCLGFFWCRCSQEQTRRGLDAPVPSAPAAPPTATAPGCSGHALPRPAQAAHGTTARHPGGSRCVKMENLKEQRIKKEKLCILGIRKILILISNQHHL